MQKKVECKGDNESQTAWIKMWISEEKETENIIFFLGWG